MAFSHQTFNKLQKDDLIADLARRQADEEGRLSILKAQGDITNQRENSEIRRDAAETNRVYREGQIAEQHRATTETTRRQQTEDDAAFEKAGREREARENAKKIAADPTAPPQIRQAAQALLIGVTPSVSIKDGNGMKPTYTRLRSGELVRGKDIETDAAIVPDTTPAPSFSIVNTPDGQHTFNRRTGTLSDDSIADLPLTSQMRERDGAYRAVLPILDKLDELSARVNTNEGLYAKLAGTVHEQAAKANLDNDVAEYKKVLSALLPMAARAFGHTGVLTQQDIDSAKEIFASPSDSKELRDRLQVTVRSLLGKINSARYAADAMRTAAQDTEPGRLPKTAIDPTTGASGGVITPKDGPTSGGRKRIKVNADGTYGPVN